MTEETMLKLVEALSKNGVSAGQIILENTGSITYNDHRGEGEKEKKREVTNKQMAEALVNVQEFMWGQSANAVIFCALRDNHGYADNMSQYERELKDIAEERRLTWGCPDGTLRAAFKNNPYLKHPISKWREMGVPDRVMLLIEKFENSLV